MARPIVHHLDNDEIARRYRAGQTLAGLAREHGVDRGTIRRALRDADGGIVIEFGNRPAGTLIPPGYVSSMQLLDRAGITYRQLDYWVRARYLHASTEAEPGSGYSRLFCAGEVAVACLVGRLIADGLTPQAAFRVARELAETGTSYVAGIRIDLPQEA